MSALVRCSVIATSRPSSLRAPERVAGVDAALGAALDHPSTGVSVSANSRTTGCVVQRLDAVERRQRLARVVGARSSSSPSSTIPSRPSQLR